MDSTIKHKMQWVSSKNIKESHKNLQVKQVSCFVFSKEKKLLIVSKDSHKWGITAGHFEPKKDLTFEDTSIREVYEESGLDILPYKDGLRRIGYCVVQDWETKTQKILDEYIQVRMYLVITDKISTELILKPTKKDTVKYAKFLSIDKALTKIKWLNNSDEWKIIKNEIF